MIRNKKTLNRKKGMVLVIVLGLVMLIVFAAMFFASFGTNEIRTVKRSNDSVKAFYLAEAGLQDAICRLNSDFDHYKDIEAVESISGAPLSYAVEIYPPVPPYDEDIKIYSFTVTSKGTSGGVSRKIQQTVELGLTWGFADYALYFGGTADMLVYQFDIGKEANITGDIFGNGDISIGKDFYLDGDVRATGSISLDKDSVVTGELYSDSEMPAPAPVLVTSWYDEKIALAAEQSAGDASISGTLSSTIDTYVNGTATISGNISVATGEDATIVATGDIVISPGISVGQNITMITDGTLTAGESYSIGKNCLLYSSTLVDIQKDGNFAVTDAGSVIITPETVKIAKGFGFYGFIFANTRVEIAKDTDVTGVIAGNGTLYMGKDATLVHNSNLVEFDKIPGLSVTAMAVRNLKEWKEIVPAD